MSQTDPLPADPRLLGQLLLAEGLVAEGDLERALASQARIGGRLGSLLMRVGALSEDNLLQVLSRQLGLPVMDAGIPGPDEEAVKAAAARAPAGLDWVLDQQVLVWDGEGGLLYCAARDPLLDDDPVVVLGCGGAGLGEADRVDAACAAPRAPEPWTTDFGAWIGDG